MSKIIDETNNKYGKLTVIKIVRRKKRGVYWLCKCDCGKETVTLGTQLRYGRVNSCGCLRGQNIKEHGPPMKLPEGEAAFNFLVNNMKQSAKKRGYNWSLTKEQTKKITKMNCTYCGTPPSNKLSIEDLNGDYIYSGLDRVNNKEGYEIDNIVPCCMTCNLAKRQMTTEEFFDWISKVYNHCKFFIM